VAKFTDSITIRIQAGHGGPGAVSFRREKYIPKGGPDGGDGGVGGDVILMSDRRYYNLSHLFKDRQYRAESGKSGTGRNKHGRDGEDLRIAVPPGTEVIDAESGDLLADLAEEGAECVAAVGGIGGKGNAHFKTATFQTPRFAQEGMPGDERRITLNLKLIADVGLVGLPNSGKSTLLSRLTNARPKIADYPFTTLTPNLGIVQHGESTYRIADIPGIIEGAHRGHGLGLSFLQHIERVRIILYLIDITGEDLMYNYRLLQSELETYKESLVRKEHIVVLTKTDLADPERIEEGARLFQGTVIPVSSMTGKNLDTLLSTLDSCMEKENAS
jgi:GTPase